MIEVSCTCGKKIKVPDTMAGKKGKCPACGTPLEIPAAPPPAPKKDDLLELEDERPKARPAEAMFPPVQDLPDAGGPKKKGAGLEKKAPAAAAAAPKGPPPSHDDLIGHIDDRKKSRAPQTADTEGKISCPQCGEKYDPDVLFCMKCKVDIATGKPISGLTMQGGKTSRPGDEFDPDLPFWKITLGMLYKPGTMMQYFASWFERKDVQVQMIGFYVLSFVAIAIAAGAKSSKEKSLEVKAPSAEEQIAKIEAEGGKFEAHVPTGWTKSGDPGLEATGGKPFVMRINEPTGEISAGETFSVRFSFCEPGPGKGLDGDAWVIPTESWKGPKQEYAEWTQARSAGQPGDYVTELDAETAAGSSYVILLYPKGADPFESGVKPQATVHVAWKSKAGWGKKIYEELADTPGVKGSIEEEAAKLEKKKAVLRAPTDWTKAYDSRTGRVGQIGNFYWRVENPPGEVEAGSKFLVMVEMALEVEEKPGTPIDADVWAFTYGGNYDVEDEEEHKPQQAKNTAPGKYGCEVTAVYDRATSVELVFCPKGQELTYNNRLGEITLVFPTRGGWGKKVAEEERKRFEKEHEDAKPSTVKGKAKKALMGGAAVFGAILANLIGLLIGSAIYFGAARFFGGGGSYLLMVVTLAYLTGFTNLMQIAVLFVPAKDVDWVAYVAWAIELILYLMALMKVFDMNLMGAIIAVVAAGFIKFLIVVWLIIALLGTAMMVAS